jgi:hypothetical protein
MAIIPAKNPQSLIAYYLGFLSLLPFIGLPFTLPAIICGILALKALSRNPEIEGGGHAWVGIVLAVISIMLWGGILLLGVIGAVLSGGR